MVFTLAAHHKPNFSYFDFTNYWNQFIWFSRHSHNYVCHWINKLNIRHCNFTINTKGLIPKNPTFMAPLESPANSFASVSRVWRGFIIFIIVSHDSGCLISLLKLWPAKIERITRRTALLNLFALSLPFVVPVVVEFIKEGDNPLDLTQSCLFGVGIGVLRLCCGEIWVRWCVLCVYVENICILESFIRYNNNLHIKKQILCTPSYDNYAAGGVWN